jgi:hypothetical protein
MDYQRVKDRADVIRMNARGDYIETIATDFDWHVETVRSVGQTVAEARLGRTMGCP